MPVAALNEGHLGYRVRGQGAPLLLVLPQSSGPVGLEPMLDALAARHTLITFDPRGLGTSSPAPQALSMETQAADALGLMDALDLTTSRLLCHSTGCGVGLTLAARHPERVSRLALLSPWTHGDPFLTQMQTLRKAAARALDPEQYQRFNASVLFPPEFRRRHEAGFTRLAREAASRPQDATAFARRLDAILAFDARPLWQNIRCPTLVMAAADDQLMPPWFAGEAASAIEHARLELLDGGGHMLPETRTDDVVAAVLEFLDTR